METVESDTTVLYPDATNASISIGLCKLHHKRHSNTGYGGMYVNATNHSMDTPLWFRKANTYYEESNCKSLKWNIAAVTR